MKKLLSVLLTLVLIISLTACGKLNDTAEGGKPEGDKSTETANGAETVKGTDL
ncbi:MAG: hypothetical protein WCD89_03295 [Anaerocolumna sp.]